MAESDSPSTSNPFGTKDFAQVKSDLIKKIVVMFFTYFTLICFVLIFANIVGNGFPVLFPGLFEKGEPVFDAEFLTKAPGTLVSFEDEQGDIHKMDIEEYTTFRAENPDAVVRHEHRHSYSGGGIFGPLIGTVLLVVICTVVSLAVGIASAIYINEYSNKGTFIQVVRLAILNLAGVPSIVFGLFGLGFFCLAFPVFTTDLAERSLFSIRLGESFWFSLQGFGTSMIAGGLTLAVMILPVIITACEESLKAVPMGFREASLALGATKWETIQKAVLPYAFPGMLTASVLGITRVAGETAPIMFTAALAHKDKLPWQGLDGNVFEQIPAFFSQSVQAMPYHIYTVAARIPQSEFTKPMQYGAVFVFMIVVMLLAALSVYLRIRVRNSLKW